MKRVVVGAAVVALAVAGIGTAQAESGFKVTGGGQAFAGEPGSGPGDTYGFNAQNIEGESQDAAKGQFNSVQRAAGAETAKGQGEHIKGEVTCLVTLSGGEDGAARFGGIVRGQETAEDPLLFAVDVTDNGEGNAEDDLIVFRTFNQSDLDEDENACDQEPEEQEEIVLARGNVQIHNYTAPE